MYRELYNAATKNAAHSGASKSRINPPPASRDSLMSLFVLCSRLLLDGEVVMFPHRLPYVFQLPLNDTFDKFASRKVPHVAGVVELCAKKDQHIG